MTPAVLAGALTGAGIGAGQLLLALAVRGRAVESTRPPGLGRRLASRLRFPATRRRAAGALGVAAVLAVTTGWPVLALAGAALVGCWPALFRRGRSAAAAIARLEALATWTESLRDTIAGAVGLEQAIPASLATAQPPIHPQLANLAGRLRAREPLPAALHRLADELADGSADVVVAALILGARLRGPGLADTLGAVADSAREELDLRRHIEAQRRRIHRNVTTVLSIFAGMASLLWLANRPFLAPYASPAGQAVLAVLLAALGGCLAALSRLSRAEPVPRFLVNPDPVGPADPGSGR